MPCYRCGTRQVDPVRGASPWRRGVRADRQVLICPGCQATVDWAAELDGCPECASVHLVRRLGEVECRDCGTVAASGTAPVRAVALADAAHAGGARAAAGYLDGVPPRLDDPPGVSGPAGLGGPYGVNGPRGLADEVEEALARVLGRPGRPSGGPSLGA